MKKEITLENLIKVTESIYEIPKTYRSDMRVAGRVFANEKILKDIMEDYSLDQLANVATLPGIQKFALAMPDIHQGYGFPIGGVAAMSVEDGIISPGGIGYDINCGVRLLASDVTVENAQSKIEDLATELYNAVPSGVGVGGKLKMEANELNKVLKYGAPYMVEKGFGNQSDLDFCESGGVLTFADPSKISDKAKDRGFDQLGTLGSGNHFLEVQIIEEIYDQTAADIFGLKKGCLTVMIHCGSRGLGHQTCTDYVRIMMAKLTEWGITLPDRELACAPFKTKEGQDYFAAMSACANFAWANRHMIGYNVREVWKRFFGIGAPLDTVYDVAHNIGKVETHIIDGKKMQVVVHRKGATRAFPAQHPELPQKYKSVGHPVLIPGTMGTASYILVGTPDAMNISFGSCCHGAGRRMSRVKAKKSVRGSDLRKQLEEMGIIIRCDSNAGLAEEAPIAYKDVENVVDVVVNANIAQKVAKLKPYAVIKGG